MNRLIIRVAAVALLCSATTRTAAVAASASATVTVAASSESRSANAWSGDFAPPAPLESVRPADALSLLPKVRRTTPTSVTGAAGPGGNWSLVGPQAGAQRFTPAVIVDPPRQRLLSFGGADSAVTAATWAFSFATGSWAPLATAGTPPPARRLHGAVYDSNADRMLVFGGLGGGGLLDDVWQLPVHSSAPNARPGPPDAAARPRSTACPRDRRPRSRAHAEAVALTFPRASSRPPRVLDRPEALRGLVRCDRLEQNVPDVT